MQFIKEVYTTAEGREVRADVVFSVPLKASFRRQLPTGLRNKIKNFKFVFLVEHKAQNAKQVCEQLAKMILPASASSDSIVLPVVVYHGKEKWTSPRNMHAFIKSVNPLFGVDVLYKAFAKNVPNFEYRLLDLNKMSLRELKARGLTYVAFPYTLKMIWSLEARPRYVLGGVLTRAEKLPASVYDAFIRSVLLYFRSKCPGLVTKEELVKTATKVKARKAKAKFSPLRDLEDLEAYAALQEFELGIKKGLQQGVKKGRQEGLQEVVQLMLKRSDIKQVAKLTGMSVQKIQKIKRFKKAT